MNDLTAKAGRREAAIELFTKLGWAKEVGLRGTSRPVASSKTQRWSLPVEQGSAILGRLIQGVDLLCQVLLCLLVLGNTEVLRSGGDNPMANWPDSLMVASTPVEEG